MKLDQVYVISLDHSEEYIQDLYNRLSKIPLPYDTPVFIIDAFLGTRLKTETDFHYLEQTPDWANLPEFGLPLSYPANA